MEYEEGLPADLFVAILNKIAPQLACRVLAAARERCYVPGQLCRLVD